jgi:hypothetical protein
MGFPKILGIDGSLPRFLVTREFIRIASYLGRTMKKESASRTAKNASQIAAFKKTARELGCDESEAGFDKALKKIGKAKPKKSTG